MFPLRDNNPTSSTAYVTIGLIVINAVIFLYQRTGPEVDSAAFTWKYGFIPAEFVESAGDFDVGLERHPPVRPLTDRLGRPLFNRRTGQPAVERDEIAFKAAGELPASVNIFTAMFLHGGWMHLAGNMLFLWIFGNNVEERLGSGLYALFYLATGVCGNLLHTFFETGFSPLIGASGAISGVMGGYLLLFPKARILAFVPIGWYPATFSLPAWVFLGFYLVMQNFFPAFRGGASGVAYWAHIGGFISGILMMWMLPRRPARSVAPAYDPRDDNADFII